MGNSDESRRFDDFVDEVFRMRVTNKATLKDIVDLRKFMTEENNRLRHEVERVRVGKHANKTPTTHSSTTKFSGSFGWEAANAGCTVFQCRGRTVLTLVRLEADLTRLLDLFPLAGQEEIRCQLQTLCEAIAKGLGQLATLREALVSPPMATCLGDVDDNQHDLKDEAGTSFASSVAPKLPSQRVSGAEATAEATVRLLDI
eukprot:NODE_4373_length_681_cov_172.936102.p1 GENE.NODE_4373_length_681_cov_172.936102~~NODE_4373_length_681_cov_172.936102.p1  ORF type:complete len:201 (+),score=61.85 NODE_4373_length_681_cov_172.936102:3-605(+)